MIKQTSRTGILATLGAAAALAVALLLTPAMVHQAPAHAQVLESDVDDLRYRIRQLERKLKGFRGRDRKSVV